MSAAPGTRVTRDVAPEAVGDLLTDPPRASVSFVVDGAPMLLPARARLAGGANRFGVVADEAPDLDGREVVLVVDDGPYWFELRGVSVRGMARRASDAAGSALAWYAIDATRILAWDYGTVRWT